MQDGWITEFDQEITRFFTGEKKKNTPLTFSIPKTNPLADDLLRLAGLLANQRVHQSGMVEVRQPIDGADTAVIALIRRMGINVDALLEKAGIDLNKKSTTNLGISVLAAASNFCGFPSGTNEKLVETLENSKLQ